MQYAHTSGTRAWLARNTCGQKLRAWLCCFIGTGDILDTEQLSELVVYVYFLLSLDIR